MKSCSFCQRPALSYIAVICDLCMQQASMPAGC